MRPPNPHPKSKPYVKLAGTLMLLGAAMFTLERYGLGKIDDPNHPLHLGSAVISALVLVPIGLVAAGALVFIVGRMRRL